MTSIDSSNRELIKIENMPIYDKYRRLYRLYPGPLVRGVSHKKTVIEFCEEKLKQDDHIAIAHRSSYSLLWKYLVLMLRQNGNYTEGDISELLMKNADDFKAVAERTSSDEIKNATNEDATDESEGEDVVTSNSATQSNEELASNSMSDKVVLHKFRDFLLYGNINDALDFATENDLWGHALFLASKVDRRQHANVMLKFANKLPYNDPLQTLYQIMSGRMPACVTNLDDKWGDWRPHLAMIISNCIDKPELVKRSIVALGDSLSNRGDIFGSQFCYLLVEPHFREYSELNSDSKIALLGTSHQRPFKEFATDDAIVMTEIYEYARSLSEDGFFIPSLQKYKFLLAGKMLDYGLQLKCLLYMEQIAKCIAVQPDAFDRNFTSQVYVLADRLKFYDPVMEKSYEDNFNNNDVNSAEDQKWLQDLSSILNGFDNAPINYQPQYSQEQTPQHYPSESYNPPVGVYDPMSQHQTPVHNASSGYVDDQQQQHQFQAEQPAAVETFNQYQQHDDQQQQIDPNYSYEYNSSTSTDFNQSYQPVPDQPTYDPTAYQQHQPVEQPDYGWNQVSLNKFS